MKKTTRLFLSLAMLLTGVSVTKAEDVTVLVPDQAYTSVDQLVGKDFAIIRNDGGKEKALFGSGAQNLGFDDCSKAFVGSSAGYLWRLEAVSGTTNYLLRLITPTGGEYSIWGGPGYLNSQDLKGWCSFILGLTDKMGQDIENGAVWTLEYVTVGDQSGFTMKNVGTGKYLNNNGTANADDPAVWTFCSLKEDVVENPIEKPNRTATDAKEDCFGDMVPIDDGAAYDAETRNFTGRCGYKWTDGVDLSQYQYLVITAAQTRADAGAGNVRIMDNMGHSVNGDGYGGEGNMNMWMSLWNHHNCCTIDLEKLRLEKQFNIYSITELSIDGGTGFVLGNVYASNTAPLSFGPWSQGNEGSYRRTRLDENRYGTICLPYQAAVAGAFIYEVAGQSGNTIELNRVDHLMDAGKPYFFCTVPNKKEAGVFNDEVAVNNVYFYQATAATVDAPVANNGMVGTFAGQKVPANCYVLSDNQLLRTHDGDLPTAGENRGWIDPSQITSSAGVKGMVSLQIDDATGISSLATDAQELQTGIYDLSGRRVTNPSRGLYIINGKKVVVK